MADVSGISFSGLASGLDTSKIIDTMLKIDQSRIDTMTMRRAAIDTNLSVYGQLNSKLYALQSKLDALRFSSQIMTRGATTDTPSGQPTVVSATADNTAQAGSFKVWVDQLATTTTRVGASGIGDATFDPNAAVASSGLGMTPTAGKFTIGGVTIDASAATTVTDFINAINSQQSAVVAEAVDALGNALVPPDATATKVQLRNADGSSTPILVGSAGDTSNFLTAVKLDTAVQGGTDRLVSTGTLGRLDQNVALQNARLATAVNPTGGFTINGVAFTYDASVDSISSIVTQINASAANVNASYDAVSNRVSLTSKGTGAQSIAVSDTGGGNLMAALGVTNAAGATETLGQNAQYRIDSVAGGAVQTSTSNTITGIVPGVTLSLKQQSATPVTVTVAQDPTKPMAAMKDVVTAINDLLDFVKTNSSPASKTAAAGALAGNLGVRLMTDRIKSIASGLVSGLTGPYKSLIDIGLNTGAVGSAPGSTTSYQLDEAKFSAAITANPQAVYDLMNSTGAVTGAFSGLRSYLQNQTLPGGIVDTLRNSGASEQSQLDRRIDSAQEQLDQKRRRLQMQFANMESALSTLQSQSQRIQQQLGSG
jgi:flagellar hook-associated protein 2